MRLLLLVLCAGLCAPPLRAQRPPPVLQAPIAVKPPTIDVPAAAVPPAPATPAQPPPRSRAPVLTACDPGGCWDSEGRRLNRAGAVLLGPGGACSTSGVTVQCP